MKLKLLLALLTLCALLTNSAQARPYLLELFTSEGCSSCPAGEETIKKLSKRNDVFVLSYHVNYWDKLGWKDPFATQQTTQRQHDYMNSFGNNKLYTPQVVIDGADETVATWGWRVKMLMRALEDKKIDIDTKVYIDKKNKDVIVKFPNIKPKKPLDIYLVHYLPEIKSHITAGENSGRYLNHLNVVRQIQKVSQWVGGSSELRITDETTYKDAKRVVLIQEKNAGNIISFHLI